MRRSLRLGILLAALVCSPIWLPMPNTAQATLPPVTNFAKVTVSTGYNSAAVSVVLLSGHGSKLPSSFPFPLVWWNATDYGSPEDDPFVEIVSVTARSGDTLTVIRAQEGTAASNHNTGAKTYRMVLTLTKSMWDQIQTDITATYGAAAHIGRGAGSPEGVVTAPVGDLWLRTDGSTGTTLYRKESGSGNTGWISSAQIDWTVPGTIGSVTPNTGVFTTLTSKQLITTGFAPTYGTTVTIDASLGGLATITATNNTGFLIANPTSAFTGNWLSIQVVNTSGGALGTVQFDTLYKMATFTKPQNGTYRVVTFRYNGTNWHEMSCSPEVPN